MDELGDAESPLLHQVQGFIGSVSDDSIDAQIEQPSHIGHLVNGPHVHLNTDRVCSLNQSVIQHGNTSISFRDLECVNPPQRASLPAPHS